MDWDDEVSKDIAEGGHDGTLDELDQAISLRRKEIARQFMATLNVGDEIRIKGGPSIRPKYLAGATAHIREIRITKLTVEFPDSMGEHDPYGKFAGKRWIVPPTLVEKVA